MIGVYKITNLVTGDFYIGKSKNTKKRMYNHRYPNIHGEKFEKDIKQYGWENFSFEVIEECSIDNLLEREAYYIESLKPPYNVITRGGKRSPETIEKMRAAMLGKKQSAETIAKRKATINEYRKSHPQTNAGHKKKVCTDYGEFGYPPAHFDSIKEAANFFGVRPSTVSAAIKRKGKVRGVSVWLEV